MWELGIRSLEDVTKDRVGGEEYFFQSLLGYAGLLKQFEGGLKVVEHYFTVSMARMVGREGGPL